MENPRELFEIYKRGENWSNVDKSHKNLFVLGAEAVMLRGADMLHEFFNYRSDANKYLEATQQEDLENEFGDWLKEIITSHLFLNNLNQQ